MATIPLFIRAEKTESEICLAPLYKVMREEDMGVKKALF